MLVKQLVRFLQYEYSHGSRVTPYLKDALQYYYEKHDKKEMERNKNLLKQFKSNKNYSRISLHNGNDFEVALISWDRDATSGLHQHYTDCGFMLLHGNLYETKYDINKNLIDTYDIKPSEISTVAQGIYHNVFNIHTDKSLSIHVYDNRDLFENNYNFVTG